MNTEIDDSIVLDAMRYRWLRHGDNDEKVLKTYTSRPSEPGEPTMFLPRNDELDRLIDAARAARAPADSVLEDAARYRFLAGHCRSTSEHWGGRWSIVVDGPAPKSHDSEDDFDEAVDAALAAQRGNK